MFEAFKIQNDRRSSGENPEARWKIQKSIDQTLHSAKKTHTHNTQHRTSHFRTLIIQKTMFFVPKPPKLLAVAKK